MKLEYIIDQEYDRRYVGMSTKIVRENFDEIYKSSMPYLKYTKKAYQLAWNEINKKFSDYIAKETGYDWFYPKYQCVISVANQGISNWGNEPKIVRGWKENAYNQRRITAHELILSHYFEIYRRKYSHCNLTDNQVWALAEIAAFALTSLTETARKFWPWDYSGYYINHNYPQIVPLQKELKNSFLKKKNFDQYILAGIKSVNKYKKFKINK